MKFWIKYIKPHLRYFILGPSVILIEVIGEVLMPKYLAMIINNATSKTPIYSVGIALFASLTGLMMMAGGVGGAYFGTKASVKCAADIRKDMYKKIQTFSYADIDKFNTGSLITRLTNDITQVQNFISILLRVCVRAPGMLIGSIIMAIFLRPSLSWILLVSIPFLGFSISFVILKGMPRFTKMQGKIDNLNNTVQENVTNVRVVKSFVRENYETKKFKVSNQDYKKSEIDAMKIMILLNPIMSLCMNLSTILILWFGSKMVLSDTNAMPIGDLSAFIAYCNQILSALMMVTMAFVMSSRSIASGKRIKEVLIQESTISDDIAQYKDIKVLKGNVEFKNVSFRYYKNSEEAVLNSVSLTIKSGSTVGIIGSTGSGKTTLVSMIDRLYDPDEGAVLVDGVNVKDYSLENLREGIGMVLQKNVLFSGTIEENLRWGNQNATF